MYAAMLALCALLALATVPQQAVAQANVDPAPLQFTDTAEERRFHALVAELRCVMCQNQSLADSDAQIAHDLRREVLELMQSGRSDDEIKDFIRNNAWGHHASCTCPIGMRNASTAAHPNTRLRRMLRRAAGTEPSNAAPSAAASSPSFERSAPIVEC